MSLKGKLRTGILATTLSGLIGCADFEELRDDFIESATWEMAAARLEEKGEYEKARAMRNIGNARVARKIAEAGRSEVNVYTNRDNNSRVKKEQSTNYVTRSRVEEYFKKYISPPENVVLTHEGMWKPDQGYGWIDKDNPSLGAKKIINDIKQSIVDENFKNSTGISDGKFYYFAANYYRDFDENGFATPNEFVGIKNKFRDDEKLTLVSDDGRSGLKGHEGKIEIYSPNGNIIYTEEYINPHNNGEIRRWPSLMDFLFEKSGYGNYKAVWKLDGKYDGSTEFEIVPSLRNEKVTKKD